MTLMMGVPVAAYLSGLRFRSRFSGLAPSLAAELEAFAAEQEAKPQAVQRPLRCREA
jgi:hypothetical protein